MSLRFDTNTLRSLLIITRKWTQPTRPSADGEVESCASGGRSKANMGSSLGQCRTPSIGDVRSRQTHRHSTHINVATSLGAETVAVKLVFRPGPPRSEVHLTQKRQLHTHIYPYCVSERTRAMISACK